MTCGRSGNLGISLLLLLDQPCHLSSRVPRYAQVPNLRHQELYHVLRQQAQEIAAPLVRQARFRGAVLLG